MYEIGRGQFPTAQQIAEALEISEADAAKGLAAMVKARKAGAARPIQFSPAQKKQVEALKKTLELSASRFERETRQRIRKEEQERAQFQINLALGQEANRLASDRLAEHAQRKGATFTVAEYRLLWLVAHPDTRKSVSDHKRIEASQLLENRALIATGGLWGKKGK